jgi:hypothetical protein
MNTFDGKIQPSGDRLPLSGMDGRRLGAFTLVLGDVKALRRSGWRGFSLRLKDLRGNLRRQPVVRGIYSMGGKDGVRAWMDIDYWEEIPCEDGEPDGFPLSLHAERLDREIFRLLGETIPPGGHLMVSYEGDQDVHRETLRELAKGVPPVATSLGHLLFFGGFRHVKDWYLAEGGMEGPRKLWGEKAPDTAWEHAFGEWTLRQLVPFLERSPSPEPGNLLEAASRRAEEVLRTIREENR